MCFIVKVTSGGLPLRSVRLGAAATKAPQTKASFDWETLRRSQKRLFLAFQRPGYSLGIRNQVALKMNRGINSTVRTLMNSTSPIQPDVISISKRHSGRFSPPPADPGLGESTFIKAASALDAAPGWRCVFVSVWTLLDIVQPGLLLLHSHQISLINTLNPPRSHLYLE